MTSKSPTRSRVCGRSMPSTPSTSTAGNGSSNDCSPASGRRGRAADSSPSSGRAGAASRASCRAGLLPAVRHGAVPMSDSWFTIEMTPGPHPFEELEDALHEHRHRPSAVAARAARRGQRAAAGAVARVAERRLATAAVDRSVRGVVHTGRRDHGRPLPDDTRERDHRSAESSACRRHAPRRLLRPAAPTPWSR